MSDEWESYIKDPRTVCKYGSKCYQKNAEHHENYKHPLNFKKLEKHDRQNRRFKPFLKDVKAGVKDAGTVDKQANSSAVPEDVTTPDVLPKDEIQNEATSSKAHQISIPVETLDNYSDSIKKLSNNLQYHDSTTDQAKYKDLFLVKMPQDFFKFYECMKEEGDPEKLLASVNLQLIGPYDLLLGKLPVLDNKDLYLIHWRFFYDPPEFQAVLKGMGKSEFHIGYYRDEPDADPVFLASNDSWKGCLITPCATNIFAAVFLHLKSQKKSPFTAMAYQKLIDKVKCWAEKYGYSLEEYNMKRRKHSVARTIHSAGIVVPYDKKTQLGYRKLVETDSNIKKLFTKIEEAKSQSEKDKAMSELQPVITYANIAVDECDFGTGLEAGIDMFCSGLQELEASALNSLCSAYSLLNRAAFGTIIQAHLKCRRKGPDMSLLSISA